MHHNASTASHRFAFHGEGGNLFGQFLINGILTLITLGVYYPWAKAKMTQYYYRNTEFAGHSFEFHGTGKEMFLGFLKTVLVLIGVATVSGMMVYAAGPIAGAVTFYLILIALIPFAVVGDLRYTCSRSSWRGVHFNYQGTISGLAAVFFPGFMLTIITFGLYGSWFIASLEREIRGNARFGKNIEFEYTGQGSEIFKKVIVGYVLSILTLGIYAFWMAADLYNYSYHHTNIHQNGRASQFRATVTGGGLLKMFFLDFLLFVVSLGIATPWIITKNLKYIADNLSIDGDVDLDAIEPDEEVYTNATGQALVAAIS